MSDAVICDRCEKRIDEEWTGPMVRIEDNTSTGEIPAGQRHFDLCPECHSKIRDELWALLRGEADD
jgi:RNA polymerase subunit RPABC4/transcription elongation factor Spt4